ncbi:MAG: InlB B-repeat-containing protein, partial [Candidatus Izemoplasmatales bacterium]
HFLSVVTVILMASFFMFGCTGNTIDFSTIEIHAEDEYNVVAGTYTVDYTIDDLNSLIKDYDATVTITVLNKSDEVVSVSGNTFVVEANEVYSVTIQLTMNGESKEKTITVYAVTSPSQVTVTYVLSGGTGYPQEEFIDINTIPDLTVTPLREGYTFNGWYTDSDCTSLYQGEELIEDIILYAGWIINETAVTIVSFDLNGGVGSFPDIQVGLGSHVTEPALAPTKDGYTFVGWGESTSSTTLFDFENTTIQGQLVLYAIWEEILNPVTITYDLNGALQTSMIQETITSGSHPSGLSITPIKDGFVFAGWGYQTDTVEPLVLSEVTVSNDTTLYAIWHYSFTVLDGTNYFNDFYAEEDSTITDGWVNQLFLFNITFSADEFEDDFNIDSSRVEYGVFYTNQAITMGYYDYTSSKVTNSIVENEMDHLTYVPYIFHTDTLMSDTSYEVVFFLRWDGYLVLSQTYSFNSYITVESGLAVGANYVLSGGYYSYDNGNSSFRPSMFIEILEGYTARLDHTPYSSYSLLYREGIRTLITKDDVTGKEYLHVFHLDFQTPDVLLTSYNLGIDGDTLKPVYKIQYYFDEFISYPVSEVGFLYSTHHPYLKLDLYQVNKVRGTLDGSRDYFEANNTIYGNENDLYLRAYAIINGKVSYSEQVLKLSWNGSEYSISATYYMNADKLSPEYGYSSSFGSTNMNFCTITDSSLSCELKYSSINVSAEGQYFITGETLGVQSTISDVLIIDDYPTIEGVDNFGVYDHPVNLILDMYNPYWYMEFNGGEYIDLPRQIQLSEVGYYTIYYRTGYGMEQISFEITEPAE